MRTFWNDLQQVTTAWPTLVAKSRRPSSLIFFVTSRVGMMQRGRKASAMSVNFQSMSSIAVSTLTMVTGSLIRSERPSLRKLLRLALSFSMRAINSLVVVRWKKSSERELIFRKASPLTSLVMRWPLQARR